MFKSRMRVHFRYLRFKTFPMTPRTPQCEVFWSSKSSSEFSGVLEDSNPNFFQVLGFTPTLGQSRVATCDLFYRVAMDTARPLPKTKSGNIYILVAIDHYSKWCEAKAVADHGAKTAARFLEDDVICRYGVPKFVLTDNGGEWATEFDAMCKDYGIHHQHTTPQWPQCNGMAEHLIKTIKHGITVLSTVPDNANCWDEQLAKVMFGYRCGI